MVKLTIRQKQILDILNMNERRLKSTQRLFLKKIGKLTMAEEKSLLKQAKKLKAVSVVNLF